MVSAATGRAGAIFTSSTFHAGFVGGRAHLCLARVHPRSVGPSACSTMAAASARSFVTPFLCGCPLQCARPVEIVRRWLVTYWRGGRWISAGRYRGRVGAHVVRRRLPREMW